jgi:predicted permease
MRRSKNRDLDDEILAHFEIEVKQRMEAGETREDAERAARRQFGNVALVKEITRSMWGFTWLESLAQDLKYAARTMRRAPGFSAVAILTLALGIGANTAIFSAIDAALLRPLAFAQPDRLVRLRSSKNGASAGVPLPMDVRDFAAAAQSFESLVAYDHWRKNVSGILGSNAPEEMVVGLVPGRYFELLRMQPIMGRLFTDAETLIGKNYVAAISANLWRTRFASDPQILNRTLRINGETYSIVAVMPDTIPAWMDQTSAPISIWTPFAFSDIWTEASRGTGNCCVLGRLKPGISHDRARAEVTTISARLASEHPLDEGIVTSVEPLADSRSGPVQPVLLILGGAVGMVLLIACANLAGLFLARNSVRYREMALRSALGAGRLRLVRQLLLETAVLSVSGGALGLLFSSLAGVLLQSRGAGSPYAGALQALPQFWQTGLDPRVLLFAFAVSIATAFLFGLAPALAGTRISLADTLKEGGRSGGTGARRQHFRRMLVIAEVALSLALVAAAGLLTQSIVRLGRQNPGFRADHLLKGHIYLPPQRYADAASINRFCEELVRRLRAIPGIVDASVTTMYPPYIRWSQVFAIEGRTMERVGNMPSTRWGVVDTDYLRTLGTPIVAGRDFQESDTSTSLPVALINQEFVRRYFPNENPIGRRIRLGPPPGAVETTRSGWETVTVAGVFANFMNDGVALPPAPHILALFRQQPAENFGFKDIVVRTAVEPASMAPAISQQLRSLDAEIPLAEIETMQDYLGDQIADTRLTAALLGLFATLGTLLAIIGAYGVISYLVAQRTQEVGIRMALGADATRILWMILRQGIWMGAAGVLFGATGAVLLRQFLSKLLFRVSATDPLTLGAASLLLLFVVVIASAIPARRAMRIDPVRALRGE